MRRARRAKGVLHTLGNARIVTKLRGDDIDAFIRAFHRVVVDAAGEARNSFAVGQRNHDAERLNVSTADGRFEVADVCSGFKNLTAGVFVAVATASLPLRLGLMAGAAAGITAGVVVERWRGAPQSVRAVKTT